MAEQKKFEESNIIYSDDGFELREFKRNYFYYFDKYDGFLDEDGKYYDVDFKEAKKPEDSDAVPPTLPKFDVTPEELKKSLDSYPDAKQEIIIEYQGFHPSVDETFISDFFKKQEKEFRDVYIKTVEDSDDIASGELIVFGKKLAEEIIKFQLEEYQKDGEKYILELYLEDYQSQFEKKKEELFLIKDVYEKEDKVTVDYTGFPLGISEEEIKKFFGVEKIEVNQYDPDTDPDFEVGQIVVPSGEDIAKIFEKHGTIYNDFLIELSVPQINLEIDGFPKDYKIEQITNSLKVKQDQLWEIDFEYPLVYISLYSQQVSDLILKQDDTEIKSDDQSFVINVAKRKNSDDESNSDGDDEDKDNESVDEEVKEKYREKEFKDFIDDIKYYGDFEKLEEISNVFNNLIFKGYKQNLKFDIQEKFDAEQMKKDIKELATPPKSYLLFTDKEKKFGYIYFLRPQNRFYAHVIQLICDRGYKIESQEKNFVEAFDPRNGQDKDKYDVYDIYE